MSIFSLKENKWNVLPLLLGAMLLVLLFAKNISFDISTFKDNKGISYYIFLGAPICIPLASLFFFERWRELKTHKKLLIFSLAGLFIAANFATHLPFQFSAIFAGSVIIYLLFEKKIYRPTTFQILLITYFFINAISLCWSSHLDKGFELVRDMTPLAYVPLLFCCFKLEKKDFDLLATFLLRFSIVFLFLTIASWIIQYRFQGYPLSDTFQFKKDAIVGIDIFKVVYAWTNHMHPTYNALTPLFALSIGWFYLTKEEVQDKPRILEFVFVLLGTLLVSMIAVSRFMLMAWAIINAAGLLYSFRKNKRLLTISSVVFALAIVGLSWFMGDRMSSFMTDPIRMAHYKIAMEAIHENTWHGTGIGGMTDYIRVDNPIYDSLRPIIDYKFSHIQPHNQFLGDLMQTGIFGLLLIISIVVVLIYNSLKYRDWIAFIQILIFFLLMMIEMPLLYVNGIFLFSLIFNTLITLQTEQQIFFDFNKKDGKASIS